MGIDEQIEILEKRIEEITAEVEERSRNSDTIIKQDRANFRQWLVILALIVSLVGSNIYWFHKFTQYDFVSYQQDGEGYNNINISNGGDVNNQNGSESQSQTQEKP